MGNVIRLSDYTNDKDRQSIEDFVNAMHAENINIEDVNIIDTTNPHCCLPVYHEARVEFLFDVAEALLDISRVLIETAENIKEKYED